MCNFKTLSRLCQEKGQHVQSIRAFPSEFAEPSLSLISYEEQADSSLHTWNVQVNPGVELIPGNLELVLWGSGQKLIQSIPIVVVDGAVSFQCTCEKLDVDCKFQ